MGHFKRSTTGSTVVLIRTRKRYLKISGALIRKSVFSLAMLGIIAVVAVVMGARLPSAFLPEEDQGYAFIIAQLPYAASLERTDAVCKRIEEILKNTAGVKYCTTVEGFSLLSQVQATYNAFFFARSSRGASAKRPDEYSTGAIRAHLNSELAKLPEATSFAFSPPSIPGIGTSGGFTFMLEDRSGKQDPIFLTQNLNKFMEAARKTHTGDFRCSARTHLPDVPQVFVKVDRNKVLKQGVPLGDVYRTLQTFMGGNFVNYFNRFGRQWQVYIEAEDKYRTRAGERDPRAVLT